MTIPPTDELFSRDRMPTLKERILPWPISDWVYVLAAMVSLAWLIFQMYAGGFISLTADEFGKASLAWIGLNDPTMWFQHIWLPAHFPLLAAAYVTIGDLLMASRLVSVLCGFVAIIAIYRLGHYYRDAGVGALAAILMATSPLTVWLSATGLVDILYVAFFVLGFSYYIQWQRCRGLFALYIACGLFALSCAFHYNAWLAVMAVGMLLIYDLLCSSSRERLHGFLGLCILALVPVLWCAWNWFAHGDPLDFLHGHIVSSAPVYEQWGRQTPTVKSSLYYLASSLLRHGPFLAVLAFISMAGIVWRPDERQPLWRIWFVLIFFGGGLIILYARGGLPTAYPDRYQFLPLVIMTVLSASVLNGLIYNHERYVKVLGLLLAGIVLLTNLWLTLHYPMNHQNIQEASDIADFLEKTVHVQDDSRVLLEGIGWNYGVVGVLLNNPTLIIEAPIEPTVLLEAEAKTRRFAEKREIRNIGVWSEGSRQRLEKWGLQQIGQVGRYSFYTLS